MPTPADPAPHAVPAPHPPGPVDPRDAAALTELAATLRRAIGDLEADRVRRRHAAEPVLETWRGGRRRRFDDASARIDRTTRQVIGELETLCRAVARQVGDAR